MTEAVLKSFLLTLTALLAALILAVILAYTDGRFKTKRRLVPGRAGLVPLGNHGDLGMASDQGYRPGTEERPAGKSGLAEIKPADNGRYQGMA